MRVSIHQPAYLPWLGYIEKMQQSDIFVVLDTVQFSKNSFDNRNRIQLPNGKDFWLTVPIRQHLGQTYLEAETATGTWIDDHLRKISESYHKSPNFNSYFPELVEYYERLRSYSQYGGLTLATVAATMLPFFYSSFKQTCQLVRSQDLGCSGKGSELVFNVCKELGADEYYSGRMGKDYLDEEMFTKAGIKVEYQEYHPNNYYSAIHQLFTTGAVL